MHVPACVPAMTRLCILLIGRFASSACDVRFRGIHESERN